MKTKKKSIANYSGPFNHLFSRLNFLSIATWPRWEHKGPDSILLIRCINVLLFHPARVPKKMLIQKVAVGGSFSSSLFFCLSLKDKIMICYQGNGFSRAWTGWNRSALRCPSSLRCPVGSMGSTLKYHILTLNNEMIHSPLLAGALVGLEGLQVPFGILCSIYLLSFASRAVSAASLSPFLLFIFLQDMYI